MLKYTTRTLTAALLAGSALFASALAASAETLKIGYVGGLTGFLAGYDGPTLAGFKYAIDEANANGGLNGMKIELISRDMRSETAQAAVMAQELVAEGVHVMVVPCDLDPAIAAGQIANAAKIPAISGCASTPTLAAIAGDFVFSYYTADNLQAAALGNYAAASGYKNAYLLISKDTPYTHRLPEYFGEVFKKKGGAVAAVGEFKMGQQDFSAEVTSLKAVNPAPDVIMTSAYEPDFPAFIKALRAAGVTAPVIGSDGVDLPTTLALGGVAEGVVFSNAGFPVEGSALAAFNVAFKAATGQEPDVVYYATGYDLLKLFGAAITAAGGKLDGQAIRDGLDGLENVEVTTGKLTYKGQNRVALRNVALNKVAGGKKTFVSNEVPPAADVPVPVQ